MTPFLLTVICSDAGGTPEFRCYDCTFSDGAAKTECVDKPDSAGTPVTCAADKVCAIKRSENKGKGAIQIPRNA